MTTPSDMAKPGDIATALALLTRLPVQQLVGDDTPARAIWAYPLAGVAVGGLQAVTGFAALALGTPAALAALLVLTVGIVTTGALHEDGLADVADGFWGGFDTDRRLAIMRDSRIGAYGVIALALSLAFRWQAIAVILTLPGYALGLIAVAAISRAAMPVLMLALPHARNDGLARGIGLVSATQVVRGGVVALLIGAVCLGIGGVLVALGLTGCMVAGLCALARRKIGGHTGDVLGATQQLVEMALLIWLASLSPAPV